MKTMLPLALAVLGLTGCGPGDSLQPSAPPTLTVQTTPNPVTIGQTLSVQIGLQNGSEPLFLALFIEDPEGRIAQILPNRLPDGAPTLKAGQPVTFPPPGALYELRTVAPAGVHTALAYASREPLKLDGISSYASAGATFATVNRQGKGSLEASLLSAVKVVNPGISQLTSFEVKAGVSTAP
ncbi:DUF4384 domain-containing protein [Deinococcus koreensis]|uniref:DUF4384 domain-containing protein n=1 Tax=Deinococcus koreensis TaxID=2054903 RepID=A0A2K3UXU8_9DEIO|nr:DUF4384 domain-containing protein [Deinococcus koreensis]PNY81367.1 hypothetical protein CVO96_08190 [Deinococcus koreensis]